MLKRIENPEALSHILQGLRSQGKVVVLTIGSFENLRAADIKYLEDAQSRGDYLIVAVGTKWPGSKANRTTISRNSAKDRAVVMAAIRGVHYVTTFEEATADKVIQTLRPSVIAYSTEWTERTAPERKTAQELSIPILFCGNTRATAGASRGLVKSRKGK